jgi:superfamily II DNA or RNA helicase
MNYRRLRRTKDRARLYLDFDGKCAECGVDLQKWHADHKIPFKLTRCTEYVNMQPLCPPCNLKKGSKVLSLKNRSYYESLNLGLHVDIVPFRIGQRGAFNCIVEKVMDNSQTISIVLPTRYGKSDVMRATAIELIERGIADSAILAAPCRFLRDQLCRKKKIDEMVNRYTIVTRSRPIAYDIMENFRLPIFQNEEYFVALCTQMLANKADEICGYIRLRVKKSGKPVLVYIDESHTSSEKNVWGAVVPKIVEAGGIVTLSTATPYRDNGQKIPGFKCVVEPKRERLRYVPRQHEDPSKYYLDIYKDLEGEIKLEADYEYTFKSAWAEGDVLCKVGLREFDVIVKIPDGNSSDPDKMKELKISEMTPTECSKYFSRVTRDTKVIKQGVFELVKRLREYRLYEPQTQAIIFCGNDIDEEDDGHAKQIAAEIGFQDTSFKVIIATSKQDSADELIKDFGDGKGDILIVKQMASLGMDIPPIKIGLDLSSVRTLAAFVQRMMRTATMWGKNQTAHLIMPSDVNGQALWKGFIEENGGAMTSHETTKLDTIEKDKQDRDPSKKTFEVVRTEDAILSDSCGDGTSSSSEYDDFALPLILALPKIQAVYSDHELVSYGKKIGKDALGRLTPIAKVPTRDITEQRILLKNRIENLRKEIASQKFHYRSDTESWRAEMRSCLNKAKRKFGIALQTKLDKITKIETLNQIVGFLEEEKNNATKVVVQE